MPRILFVSYLVIIEAKIIPVSLDEPNSQLTANFIAMEGHTVRGYVSP